jgi:restriction system protein
MRNYQLLKQRRADALRAAISETEEHNRQIDEFISALENADPRAIKQYFEMVFHLSQYPTGFPKKCRIAYITDSRQLVVDYQMPTIDEIVPSVEKYKYTKSSDEISETKKPERIRQQIYADAISSTVLRTLHETFAADKYANVDVAVINAFVDTIDRSTGQQIQPYILSTRTTRDEFQNLVLKKVDPTACLKRLTATISRNPAELVPIKPIVDINMVDPRFIDEQDILSTLDNRTNLMTLSPGEFESLITNLFQKMGLETKLTQASRDGGVDCVAFDQRPILGGKVVVQAKRYKNTVGVGSVRDLYGTMLNEGASKGILVTTSGYGKASFEFANGKPIELISGANLLYLLREHAGVDAKIEPPEDWIDFQANSQ